MKIVVAGEGVNERTSSSARQLYWNLTERRFEAWFEARRHREFPPGAASSSRLAGPEQAQEKLASSGQVLASLGDLLVVGTYY